MQSAPASSSLDRTIIRRLPLRAEQTPMPELVEEEPDDDPPEDLPTIAIPARNLALGSSPGMVKLEREPVDLDIRPRRHWLWLWLLLALVAAVAIVLVLAARVPVISVGGGKGKAAPEAEPSGIIVTPIGD